MKQRVISSVKYLLFDELFSNDDRNIVKNKVFIFLKIMH